MAILPDDLDASTLYKLLTGIVVPRPIAWVTSLGSNGVVNLAPFSCFTFVSPKPPMIGVSVGTRDGTIKDTARNILANGEFTVNIADETMIDAVHRSAEPYPPDVSEAELLGLGFRTSERVVTPYLAETPISMECLLDRSITCGSVGSQFIIGEIVAFHIREGLCVDWMIDTARLRPACRIAGPNYATLGKVITCELPDSGNSKPQG